MSDERAKSLDEATLICRERGIHPTVDLVAALKGEHGGKARVTRDAGVTRVERDCLTDGCKVYAVDEYGPTGFKIMHELIYPKSGYLLPPGGGYLHRDDVRAEIWKRYGKANGRKRKAK